MKPTTILVHRYNDPRDIFAVPQFKCSETHVSRNCDFEGVLVIPTTKLECKIAVYGIATSDQKYVPPGRCCDWPSGLDYEYRVDLDQIRFVYLGSLREGKAITKRGDWSFSRNVFQSILDVDRLEILKEDSVEFRHYKRNALRPFVRASL